MHFAGNCQDSQHTFLNNEGAKLLVSSIETLQEIGDDT